MKVIKLSLATIICTGLVVSNVNATENLGEALSNSKISGVLRQVWRQKNKNGKTNKEGFSIGARLELSSKEFYGFKANVGFQTSTTPITTSAKKDKSFSQDRTNMNLANLAYTYKETETKVGRVFIKTPLLRNRSSRILKDSFDGIFATNTSIPDTEIIATAITKWHAIDESEDTNYDNPVYAIYANSLIGAFDLTAQATFNNSTDETKDDTSKDYYLEAKYKTRAILPITLAAQYIGYSNEADSDASSSYGLMTKVKVSKGFSLGVIYTDIKDDDGYVRGGYGESLDPSWNSMVITDANEDGIDILRGAVYYKANGIKAEAYYSDIRTPGEENAFEYGLEAKYKLKGILKGLSFETKLAKYEQGDSDKTQLRFYSEYKF